MGEWKLIETAPRDGTEIDLWVVDNRWDGNARRYTDCSWHPGDPEPNAYGHQFMPGWYHSEANGEYGWRFNDPSCPREMPTTSAHTDGGTATHWMPVPGPPASSKSPQA